MSDVVVRQEGPTRLLTFNRPERHNSIGGELLGDLIEAVEAADEAPETRAVVTIGSGRSYCVGLDVQNLASPDGAQLDLGDTGTDGAAGRTGLPVLPLEARRVDTLGIGRWVQRFTGVGTPTIAAINGTAAGGGFAVAMLHDQRVMSSEARLFAGFGALGLSSEMGLSWILPRLVGSAKALRIMTRSTPISAEEALALGLVDEVVDPADLTAAALELGRSFAAAEDRSVRTMKRLLQQSWTSTLGDQLEREWVTMRLLFGDPRNGEMVAGLRARLARD